MREGRGHPSMLQLAPCFGCSPTFVRSRPVHRHRSTPPGPPLALDRPGPAGTESAGSVLGRPSPAHRRHPHQSVYWGQRLHLVVLNFIPGGEPTRLVGDHSVPGSVMVPGKSSQMVHWLSPVINDKSAPLTDSTNRELASIPLPPPARIGKAHPANLICRAHPACIQDAADNSSSAAHSPTLQTPAQRQQPRPSREPAAISASARASIASKPSATSSVSSGTASTR